MIFQGVFEIVANLLLMDNKKQIFRQTNTDIFYNSFFSDYGVKPEYEYTGLPKRMETIS